MVVKAGKPEITGNGTVIKRETIENLPFRNDSINEALTVLPGVQFSEGADISTRGGDILPPAVSISGGKTFENNFTIDGISNNSLIDPEGDTDPVTNNDVPGHAQDLFLDNSLVGAITVYDSNVPARFGNFKGGVVDAEIISPDPWFGGKLFYRTTRDEWTSFHIDQEDEQDFLNSTDHRQQPKFRKHHFGFDLHLPVSSRLMTLAAYRQMYSRIPLKQDEETETQERRGENYLLKTVFLATEDTSFSFLWTYAPYRGVYFKDGFRDSEFTLRGGGHLFSVTGHTRLPLGDLDVQVAYRTSENSRKAPTDMIQTEISDNVWDKEGFLGDIEKTQESYQIKTDFAFRPFSTGPIHHGVNTGLDIQRIEAKTERVDTSYLYTYLIDAPPRRTAYEKGETEVLQRMYSFHLEDIVRWARLEVRPGVRLDYDDFTHNLNLAPRLMAGLDLFGDQQTFLIAGFNRYYANNILAYKLREALNPTYQERWSETDGWTLYSRSVTDSKYSELETPFTDEQVLGLEHQLFGGKAALRYVHRKGRDELAKTFEQEEDGIYYNTPNNNGSSRHESYRISWERQWAKHYLTINAAYQKTETSNESYDELLEEEDLHERVWYDGRLLEASEMPRKDFNRNWIVNLAYVGKFPYGFTFSGLAKYRSGYEKLKTTGEDMILPNGDSVPIFDKVKKGGSVVVSCRLEWEKDLWSDQSMILSLDAFNLLNKKVTISDPDSNEFADEIGRQIWAGLEYRF
ncbi:MAG: TonB-dependent receptor plug domain-containing protein [Syntrophotaleaceae bacterium]